METPDNWEFKIAAAKLELETERLKLERERVHDDAQKPFREAVMKFAEMTVRSLLILNGGAALALIAFVGNSVKGDAASIALAFAQMRSAVMLFGLGAFLGVATSALSYLAQLGFTEMVEHGWSPRWGHTFRALAIVSALTSLALFLCGVTAISTWK